MKTVVVIFASLAASGLLFSPSAAYSQDDTVSIDDVVLLTQTDISDETILTFLEYRNLDFVLDAETVRQLKEAGVSEEVIRFLLNKDATVVAAAPTPTYVVSTGYNTAYPSYYFGTRSVGTTAYQLGWYNHHYYPYGHTASYRPGSHYDSDNDIGHAAGTSLGHGAAPMHRSEFTGGNHPITHDLNGHNAIGHSTTNLGHGSTLSRGHSSGIGGVHRSGH